MKKLTSLLIIFNLFVISCTNRNESVSIVIPYQYETDAGYNLALAELRMVLKKNNYQAKIQYLEKGSTLPKGNRIIVGDIGTERGTGEDPMKDEAYKIHQIESMKGKALKIDGDTRGLMYGIFKLAEQLQLGKNLWDISLEMSPDFPRRMYAELGQLYDLPSGGYHLFEAPWVNHERFENEKKELKVLIDQVAKLGFNTFTIMHVNFEDYINYKYLDKEVYSKGDVHRIKAKHFAKHLTDVIDYAHDRHIEVFMQVYEFQYPPKLAELYELDLGNPEMKTIINAKVKEIFEVVPLDGLVITATESLPRSGYKSVEPWHKYGKAGAGQMMTMYHNAGKAAGKKVIFRSWMIAYGAEDSEKVIENTPEDAQFEIKHTGDDFWLNFPLTDAIEDGLGKKRPLTMTFDVYPQYYGWSRLICYLQRFAKEARIAKENGVIGIQAWASWAPGCIWSDEHPGFLPNGQLKPHDKPFYDMAGPWNNFRMYSRGFTPGQMNAYHVARLTWDVNLTADQIAVDWGTIHFGYKNAKAVSDILMNSQAAFREIYLSTEKREFSFHPTELKWATIINIQPGILEKMYQKIPLSRILERNLIGYGSLAKMEEAFLQIDSTEVSDPENYQTLKAGLEKTRLYLNTFFEFREMWWRERELQDLNGKEASLKQRDYKASVDRFTNVLESWQKYPEESTFWGMAKESFEGNSRFWRNQVLEKMSGPIPFQPAILPKAYFLNPGDTISISSFDSATIRYTLDGNDPSEKSLSYSHPIIITGDMTVKARSFKNGKHSLIATKEFTLTKMSKPVYRYPFSQKFPGGGIFGLLDKNKGNNNFQDETWQGFEGNDLDVTIDLEKMKNIKQMTAGFLQDINSWIFFPVTVEFAVSDDGKKFETVYTIENEFPTQNDESSIKNVTGEFNATARYVRIKAKNIGVCPEWHSGAGGKAWVFVDEIDIKTD